MNRKGFTLIELLGVIVIISVILLLVFPNITNSVRNNRKKTDELMFSIIKSATDLYVGDNTNKIKKINGKQYCVLISELVEADYLQPNVKYNDKDITGTKGVKIVYDNDFNYELVDKKECIELQKPSYLIFFNSEGGEFTKPGYNLYNIDNTGIYEEGTKGLYEVKENIINIKLNDNYYFDMSKDIPTKEGYDFSGWSTENGIQVYDSFGNGIEGPYFKECESGLCWIYEDDLTLYAEWQERDDSGYLPDDPTDENPFGDYVCEDNNCSLQDQGFVECENGETHNYSVIYNKTTEEHIYVVDGKTNYDISNDSDICSYYTNTDDSEFEFACENPDCTVTLEFDFSCEVDYGTEYHSFKRIQDGDRLVSVLDGYEESILDNLDTAEAFCCILHGSCES